MPKKQTEPPDGGRSKTKADVGVQVNLEPRKKGITCNIPKWLAWLIGILLFVGTVWVITEYIIGIYSPRFDIDPELMEDMGVEGVKLFRQHDRDDDGFLSIEEFEPLSHILLDANSNTTKGHEYNVTLEEWDEILTLESSFSPLDQSTMTKEVDPLIGSLDSLRGLKSWKEPVHPHKNFAARQFKNFLPLKHQMEKVGNPYYIIESSSKFGYQTLSSNRYYPPKLVNDVEITIHQLLAMFHSRPFISSRFAPQGSVACVRAYNEHFVDVSFRIHAEYQLNEPPFYPFWFTPGQFAGNLIMSRDGKKVIHFHLYVPNDKKLNIDMEWLNGPRESENMEVDIGFLPKMELKANRWSEPAVLEGIDLRDKYIERPEDYDDAIREMEWIEEISVEEANRVLEVKMYPFKKEMEKTQHQPEMAKIAKLQLEAYEFPVMMMVSLPNGTIVHAVNANNFLDAGNSDATLLESIGDAFSDPSSAAYSRFLKTGIENAKKYTPHEVHTEL